MLSQRHGITTWILFLLASIVGQKTTFASENPPPSQIRQQEEQVQSDTVHICDGEDGWPPYIYRPKVKGMVDNVPPAGASVELLEEAFKLMNMHHSITLIPWKRCLKEVLNFDGKRSKFEAFINAGYSFERAEQYYASTPIYKTHQGIFYSKVKFPDSPPC